MTAVSAVLPEVHLEVRQASGRSATFALDHVDFLIGAVPGCDLRVPGADLPSVLCLITRQPGAVRLRKLAPTQLLLVNGQTATNAELADGDRITLGAIDIYLRIEAATKPADASAEMPSTPTPPRAELQKQMQAFRAQVVRFNEERTAFAAEQQRQQAEANARQRQLDERLAKLERDEKHWQQRRLDIQKELDALAAAGAKQPSSTTPDAASADLQMREERLAATQRDVATKLRQYEADVVRLDRRHGDLERREAEVESKSAELESRIQQLQRDGAELENQASQLDEWRSKLSQDEDRLGKQKQEVETTAAQVAQRAALIEGQQATLASLRTRLERMRDDMRRQEQQLEEQRTRQDSVDVSQEREWQALLARSTELENEEKLRAQERQQLTERTATLDAAVAQLKQARQELAGSEERLQQQAATLDERQTSLAEREGVLQGRLNQLADAQQRVDAERQALRERTLAQAQAEQAREALQEHLRRRSEELAARQKTLNEQIQECQSKAAAVEARRAELDEAHQDALAAIEAQRQEVQRQAAALEQRAAELRDVELKHQDQERELQEMGRTVAEQQQELARQQEDNQRAWQRREQQEAEARTEWEALRKEAKRVVQLLPDAELRAGAALDRLSQAREQLRDHVAEIHAYVRHCQEELESMRLALQAEVQALAQKEQALRRGQDEHRLAMLAFRQQLIDWQGQITDLKRQLARGESKLERRRSEMDEHGLELDAAAVRLEKQAEALDQQQEALAQQRDELDRHLVDMRQWYRQKLRDLAGVALVGDDQSGAIPAVDSSNEDSEAIVPTGRDILSITEPMDAGDLKLGETLRKAQLIDADTLTALLMEARRQRRTLRQVLLAGGVVTVYQLASIEAGNVAGLLLGPVRVIDRLRVTPQEIVYRVFDPRRGREAVLRHLSAEALRDAGRADEFRERFAQARLADVHLAETYEVMELAERPAVLQEWLIGLPASDWPPLAAAPGVCFRLVTQAALGLDTMRKAGVVHGHLDETSLLLTGDGLVKICGLGEPAWLTGKAAPESASPEEDLRALGHIAAGWCLPDGIRKGAKTKPLPEALAGVLQRLVAGGYASAAPLLHDLDSAGNDVPPNAEAWDRLLKYVREHETPEAILRLSA